MKGGTTVCTYLILILINGMNWLLRDIGHALGLLMLEQHTKPKGIYLVVDFRILE
jgi:hypothetical protein